MALNRRHFLYLLGVGASTFALESCALADNTNVAQSGSGDIKLPPLAYDYNGLEPHIDAKTMRFH
ncbi:MAG: superoxide dismutase, partial [Cyanobacteria bacterium J06643_5]